MTNPSLLLHRRVSPFGRAKVYEVGGAVRDRVLGLDAKDLDYVITDLPAESFPTVFLHDRVDYVGESFGVYKIQLRQFGEAITPVLDVALPRTERSTGPRHADFVAEVSHELPIETDLSRRDFTMNAMAFDVAEQELIDPFGGMDDLRCKQIRFVGNPLERISEDPLRILRAYRLAVKLNFQFHYGTMQVFQRTAHLLDHLPRERVFSELWGMLSYPEANPLRLIKVLRHMVHSGVLTQIIPEYGQAEDYSQGTPYHHLALADHMFEAVSHGQDIGASPTTKLALLLHDLAKPMTRTQGEDGRAHYYRHEEVGAELAGRILTNLRVPNDVVTNVQTLIAQHMRLSPRHPLGTKGVRRFMADLGPLWRESLYHRYADLQAHAPGLHDVTPSEWLTEMLALCEAQPAETACLSDHTLALSGTEIMGALNLKPGKAVGEVKTALLQEVIDGLIPNERPALLKRLKEMHA